ncbi:HAMP domain-containing histidine kinase [Parapusillimonas sp. SGNA-6]|nr:HAMP domain-containing histidine kinase [Parapusillimonas sp. SGNA-6]
MQRKSISRRVYRSILAVSVVSMLAMVLTVLLINEDLEATMLKVEFAQERNFIRANAAKDTVFVWDTPGLSIVFIPRGEPLPSAMPKVFRGLPGDYSAEMNINGDTYLVNVDTDPTGTLYVAKNITHFEDRETLFTLALIIMALVIMAFSLLLAVLSSRRIVKPLKRLADDVSTIPVGRAMPRLEADYVDAELHSIVMTFNQFLGELESYVKRERSLLSLASHELRTPIAVMSGALDVLEQRGQLNARDLETLGRVRRACDEMKDNVDILLKLARRESDGKAQASFDIVPVARQVIDDLTAGDPDGQRVALSAAKPRFVKADPVMARMLMRNLIQNALQHTRGRVTVSIADDIRIQDEGTGLTSDQRAVLLGQSGASPDTAPLDGLGLYIVTLMAERLGWSLAIDYTDTRGTLILLQPSRAPL